ncbi:MAG: hypothetical protein HYV63_14990 [Candidatus Schekmanbacteria bacterium]|nr:hypothetical protein [Candidatus Schekmanbacteria bacterium]
MNHSHRHGSRDPMDRFIGSLRTVAKRLGEEIEAGAQQVRRQLDTISVERQLRERYRELGQLAYQVTKESTDPDPRFQRLAAEIDGLYRLLDMTRGEAAEAADREPKAGKQAPAATEQGVAGNDSPAADQAAEEPVAQQKPTVATVSDTVSPPPESASAGAETAGAPAPAPAEATPESEPSAVEEVVVESVKGVGPSFAMKLRAAGIETAHDLASRRVQDIMEVLAIPEKRAQRILEAAREIAS